MNITKIRGKLKLMAINDKAINKDISKTEPASIRYKTSTLIDLDHI